MDFSSIKFLSVLFVSFLSIHAALGDLVCEDLPKNVCAFSVSSSGQRCVLEPMPAKDGGTENRCRTSKIVVEKLGGYIESDACVKACGVDREAVGINSDAFLEPRFLQNMCTPECYEKCPNLVELYFNLAAGEGVFLPYLCERQRSEPHRGMRETTSAAFKHPPFKHVIKDEEEEKEDDDDAKAPSPSSEDPQELVEIVVEHGGVMAPSIGLEEIDNMARAPVVEQLVQDLMAPAPILENVVEEDDDDNNALAPSPQKAKEEDDDMTPSPIANALNELVDVVDMSPGPGSENIEEEEEPVVAPSPGAKKIEAPRKLLETFAFSLA